MIICDQSYIDIFNSISKTGHYGYIYVLECPISGCVKYVGRTNNFKVRYSSHVSKAKIADTPKRRWVKAVLESGNRPIMRVVDVYGWKRYNGHTENEWINKYINSGIELLNCIKD